MGKRLLRTAAALGLAAGITTVALAGPAGAGFTVVATGEVACDETTGNYVVTWTIGTDIPSAPGPINIQSAVQTPGGDILGTVDPNPIPTGVPGSTTATGAAPGSTVGLIEFDGVWQYTTGPEVPLVASVEVDGTCVAAAAAPEAIVNPGRFTG